MDIDVVGVQDSRRSLVSVKCKSVEFFLFPAVDPRVKARAYLGIGVILILYKVWTRRLPQLELSYQRTELGGVIGRLAIVLYITRKITRSISIIDGQPARRFFWYDYCNPEGLFRDIYCNKEWSH